MAETPNGVFPDAHVDFDVQFFEQHETEVQRARNTREQRRAVSPTSGQRVFRATSASILQADRKTVNDFLQAKRGQLTSFYFFLQPEENVSSFNIGSVTSATSITAPFKGLWYLNETPVASVLSSVTVGGATPTGLTVTANAGTFGEDVISWTGAMSGAVLVTGVVRQRILARSMSDAIRQTFGRYAEVRAKFDIAILELPIA